ncbi:MAG: FtsQ-type POTRA domain-containing protein [Clostridia bacterium]|nr:FtsQ-type POTRA domain-containing protein [Clostridia bacterium]
MNKKKKEGFSLPSFAVNRETDGGFRRLKQKNSKRHLKQRLYYFFLLTALLLIFVITVVAVFFRVTDIRVNGNTAYPDKEIIKASGIEKGENIYSVSEKEVQKGVLLDHPYIRSVNVNRVIPNKINIDLKCDTPDFYVDIYGEYYVISPQLKVLERFFSKEELLAKYPEIKLFKAGEVRSAIVGREMELANPNHSEPAKQLLDVLKKNSVYEGVSSVDFSDRFNIRIVYDSRLEANIGNGEELELKLRFMNEIVKDLGNGKGTIDIKDVETAYVLLDGSASFD